MNKMFGSSSRPKPIPLPPHLADQYIKGTLARIKSANPVYHQAILKEMQRTGFGSSQHLSGFFDAIASIGDKFGSVLTSAADTIGKIYVNKEQAKAAVSLAQAQSDAQIQSMNAQLQQQQAQAASQLKVATTQAEAQAKQNELTALQQQQTALIAAGGQVQSSLKFTPTTLLLIAAALGGLFFFMHKKKGR